MKKAVIFDRDGTLIVDKVFLNDPAGVEYVPFAFEALKRLRDAGYEFAVATNQSGLARGLVTLENMDRIHQKMMADFAREGIFFRGFYYCPYASTSTHPRRKPGPGMLLDAARDHGFSLEKSWMIGDKMIDVEAGHRAGARSILLSDIGNFEGENPQFAPPEGMCRNLREAAELILGADQVRSAKL